MGQEREDNKLADLLEEYHRRRALGQPVDPEELRESAGEDFGELLRILEAEALLDAALDFPAVPAFPLPFGEYTLLGELGRGAMGVVYEAIHRALGRTVALKILRTGFDTHPDAIERFRREARACAQIRHDNIVGIYEAGEHDGRHFYAMELLPGKTLGRLAKDGELPEPRAFAAALAEVVDALQVLHENGIIHRDIKPGNIMVQPSGRMILADFGIARTVDSETLTRTGEHLGTPLYMSPEQLLGSDDEVNARSDIYGLGATMYEVLAGRPVFQTRDVNALMRVILKERPAPLTDVPDGLARIVMMALEKENADRYEDAAALRDDLCAFARGDAVTGRPLNSIERGVRIARKNATPIAIAAVIGLVVTATLLLQPPDPAQLTIACVPAAEVIIEGTARGTTPVRVEVPPGSHRLILRREGWKTRDLPLQLKEGETRTIDLLLAPIDPTDPAAIEELAAAFELRMEQWSKLEAQRGGWDEGSIAILFPRGIVRIADVANYRFQLGSEFDQQGAIVFRKDGNEIYRKQVNDDWPENRKTNEELPKEVEAALKKGTEITWGFYPKKGKPVTASFRVVEPRLDERIADIEKRLEGENPLLARQLKAQLYLSEGMAMAAYAEASAVVDAAPKAIKAYAVMRSALQKMELKGTPLWMDLQRKTAGLSGETRTPKRLDPSKR